MPFFTDQVGHTISIDHLPARIISLVPSQTELLYDLGLDNKVTGITKFCIHPESWFRQKTRVGGTKKISFDIIEQLQPDLIIANKEENTKEEIESLSRKYKVWTSNINDLNSAYEMIRQIGEMTGKHNEAYRLLSEIKFSFNKLSFSHLLKACYFIWRGPTSQQEAIPSSMP